MIEIITQLRNSCPICNQSFGSFFLPYGDEAKEETKGLKLFQTLKSRFYGISKPRSVAQLNTYWAVCRLVANLVSDQDNIFDSKDIDFEVKTKVSKNNPALIKRFKMINGVMYIEPISIAFANLKHLEACRYFDLAFKELGKMVGMDPEKLINLAKTQMKG